MEKRERAIGGGNGDDVARRQRKSQHADVVETASTDGEHRGAGRTRSAFERDRRDPGLAEHDREVALTRTDVDRRLDRLLAHDRQDRLPTRFGAEATGRVGAWKRGDRLVDAVRKRVDAEPDVVEHGVDAIPRQHPFVPTA